MKTDRMMLVAACLCAAVLGCKSEQKDTKKDSGAAQAAAEPAKPLTYEDSVRVVVSAKVKAVDQTTRRVTLVDSSGDTVSFVAGKEVQRLNEVKPGDTVTAEYVASLVAELRPPTAEEKANPIMAVAVAGRTPKGTEPAAGAGVATRVVTTVQAIDADKMTVTLKGPMGDTETVKARNPDNIKKLHVGDTIVITYTEAMGVGLTKK